MQNFSTQYFKLPHEFIKAPSTRISIFLNPQIFLSLYIYHQHASGEFGGESGYFWIAFRSVRNQSDNVWMANPDIFDSDDVAKSSSLLPNNKRIWRERRLGLVSPE